MPKYSVILVEPAFEESIGFVARAMKNFGLTQLSLVNPKTVLGNNGRMRAGHAQEILDSLVIHNRLEDALASFDLSVGTSAQRAHSATNLLRKPVTPKELGKNLADTSGHVGIVFGREGTGLSNHELSLCDTTLTIPADSEYQTLNLSHAAAIVFYELHQSTLGETFDELGSADVNSAILRYFSKALTDTGVEPHRVGLTVRALRNVMARSAVRRREASLMAGALREITEAMNHPRVDAPASYFMQHQASAKRLS